jgi:hypothetical protein
MALQQGAHGWALRCGTSLARLHVAAGRAELALEVLKSVQAPIVGGAGSRDVSEARELADEIEARLAATGASAPRQRGGAALRASH